MTKEYEQYYRMQKINAKALEIAIQLTGANVEWFNIDKNGDIEFNGQFTKTLKIVAKIISNETLLAVSGKCQIIDRGEMLPGKL